MRLLKSAMLYKGIFWFINGKKLICHKAACDNTGNPTEPAEFSSKSGENFNHTAEWEKLPKSVTGGKPFNYCPRGRVEIKNGKASIIYLNPVLNEHAIIEKTFYEFGLSAVSQVSVKADGSKPYEALCKKNE